MLAGPLLFLSTPECSKDWKLQIVKQIKLSYTLGALLFGVFESTGSQNPYNLQGRPTFSGTKMHIYGTVVERHAGSHCTRVKLENSGIPHDIPPQPNPHLPTLSNPAKSTQPLKLCPIVPPPPCLLNSLQPSASSTPSDHTFLQPW